MSTILGVKEIIILVVDMIIVVIMTKNEFFFSVNHLLNKNLYQKEKKKET